MIDNILLKGKMNVLNNVSILIPFNSDLGPRKEAFHWVKRFYETTIPEAEICIGECKGETFSKSQAVNNAAKKATKEIYIIADADIIFDPSLILQSMKLLENHAWVIPYRTVFNLDQETTTKLLNLDPSWPILPDDYTGKQRPLSGWGGINIVPKKHFDRVAGFDERFLGWGGEDDAFAFSVNYLCGFVERIDATIFHLWHPPAILTHYGSNRDLLKPYLSGTQSIMQEVEKRKKLKTIEEEE
jgi:predicted glycosyltransferase involved in capsule biosynthesis